MEKTNGAIVEATSGLDREEPKRDNGSPGDVDADRRPVQIGDIIEGTPTAREFRDFPNLRDTTAQSASSGTNGGTGKRRGRPPGSGRRTADVATTQETKNLKSIEKLLLSIHLGLATLSACPEFVLEPSEAKDEADAIETFAKEYGKAIDPKTMALMNLVGTIGFIEGSRLVAIRARLKTEAKERAVKNPPTPSPAPSQQPVSTAPVNGSPAAPGALSYAMNPINE